MREIKYQAYVEDVGMANVLSIDFIENHIEYEPHNNLGYRDFADGGFKLREYTGLTDKNGMEVYEGDIVRFIFDDEDSYGSTYDEIYTVEWSKKNLQFEFSDNKYHPMGTHQGKHMIWSMSHMSYEIEVIGNIYENKELLNTVE